MNKTVHCSYLTTSIHTVMMLRWSCLPVKHFRRSFNKASSLKDRLVYLSSIPKCELGQSILLSKETLPVGSPKTPHDIIGSGVFAAKVLSLSSSVAGVVMVPIISSFLWEAASERPTMMMFSVVANTFLVLLSFTPLLLHFLTKRFPVNIYYNHQTKVFTSVHYNFFLRKMARRFTAEEVVDAQIAPEMKKVWIPLATAFVHQEPLLISLDRNAYIDKVAFDQMTKNISIPPNHD
uniref:CNNM transmembrane domain-containing protein n=1 Tax=Heterorhabditis bacteriophora TaxID=37862 RepID=A0A1I7X7I6_HETBA